MDLNNNIIQTYNLLRDSDVCNCSVKNYPETLFKIHALFPKTNFLYPIEQEKNFSQSCATSISQCHYWMAPTAVIIYLAAIFWGQRWMRDRKAYDLRVPMKYWNLFLSIFSFIGMIRVIPHLFITIYYFGFEATICSPARFFYGEGAASLWVIIFVYSKYLELFDTMLIVLRKRPLLFLHWYHHASVLLYTWDAFCVEQPAGIYFVAMNYSVHAFMYFYYYLSAELKCSLSWGIFVTISQISQMFIGIAVTIISLYYSYNYPTKFDWTTEQVSNPLSHGVMIDRRNLFGACLMYSTYLYLFADFFVKRYILKLTHQPKKSDSLKVKTK